MGRCGWALWTWPDLLISQLLSIRTAAMPLGVLSQWMLRYGRLIFLHELATTHNSNKSHVQTTQLSVCSFPPDSLMQKSHHLTMAEYPGRYWAVEEKAHWRAEAAETISPRKPDSETGWLLITWISRQIPFQTLPEIVLLIVPWSVKGGVARIIIVKAHGRLLSTEKSLVYCHLLGTQSYQDCSFFLSSSILACSVLALAIPCGNLTRHKQSNLRKVQSAEQIPPGKYTSSFSLPLPSVCEPAAHCASQRCWWWEVSLQAGFLFSCTSHSCDWADNKW